MKLLFTILLFISLYLTLRQQMPYQCLATRSFFPQKRQEQLATKLTQTSIQLKEGGMIQTSLTDKEDLLKLTAVLEKKNESDYLIDTTDQKAYLEPFKNQWPLTNSSLNSINSNLQINLENEILKLMFTTNKKITVVDWGCGKGTALMELANKITNPNIEFVGFSNTPFAEWNNARKNVRFILDTPENFANYFPDGIDIVFSHFGILYFNKPKQVTKHFQQLRQLISKQGKMIFNHFFFEDNEEMLNALGFNLIKKTDWLGYSSYTLTPMAIDTRRQAIIAIRQAA